MNKKRGFLNKIQGWIFLGLIAFSFGCAIIFEEHPLWIQIGLGVLVIYLFLDFSDFFKKKKEEKEIWKK